jgi:hypothetical protein
MVIGEWSFSEVKEHLESGTLLPTDSFYDEDVSEWLPLADLHAKPIAAKAKKTVSRLCYCGTGLPFQVCCGDGGSY